MDPSGLDWVFDLGEGYTNYQGPGKVNGTTVKKGQEVKFVVVSGFETWGGWVKIMGGTPRDRKQVKAAFDVILTTPKGKELFARMRGDNKPIWVHVGNFEVPSGEVTQIPKGQVRGDCIPYVNDPKGRGNEIWINPNFQYKTSTAAGRQSYPLDVQIVHELGHPVTKVSDGDTPDNMANVRRTENPYRAQRRRQLAGKNALIGKQWVEYNQYAERLSYGKENE